MVLLAMASARSAGLTTSALALAASWPRKVLLAELDPDGGTIAAGRAANPDPGLKTLAAAGRHYISPGLVTENAQALPGGIAVLMSPASPDRCVAALSALNSVGLGETLKTIPGLDVIADCGRIDSNSPALPVVHHADAVIFVVRSTLVDIIGLRSRLETLELRPTTRAGIAVVKEGPHGLADVAAAFQLPVVGVLEWDPQAALSLAEGRRVLGRSKLMHSAGRLAGDLAAQMEAEGVADQDVDDSTLCVEARREDVSRPRPVPVGEVIPSPAWTAPGEPASDSTSSGWGAAP
jgi:hypothetical protein